MRKTSIEKRVAVPMPDTRRELRPSHYFIEPLPYGPGWRVRFIGQYVDTGEDIELGGGIYGAYTKREEAEAYKTARSRGEAWIGTHRFVADEKRIKGFPEHVERAVNQELRQTQGIRSEEYRLGMLDVLRYEVDGTWIPYRFSDGTPECDAYQAGKEHAYRRWIESQVGGTVIDMAASPAPKPRRRLPPAKSRT